MSAFAAVGLAIAIIYLLSSTVCAGLMMVAGSLRPAAAGIRRAPGEFISLEIQSVERRARRHATAALLFAVSFGVLAALGRRDGWPDLPAWSAVATALLVAATGAFAAIKGVGLLRYRRRLRSLLAASQGVAQRLEEVQRRGHRVFHAVPIGDRVIDHVIVGPIGVFAVQLVAPPRTGAVYVSLARGSLVFGPAHGEIRLQPVTEAFARLAKELGRAVGHPVKIVPTLIAPGCKIASSDDERYLLANEQTCVTLVGWKDSTAFLMDDEVIRISEWLAARCLRRRTWGWRGAHHVCITRPGWL